MERKIWTTAAALTVVLAVTGVAWAGLPRSEETTATVAVQNELVAPAGDAGTVTLRKVDAGLEVVAVDPAVGWDYTVKHAIGNEVEVDFRSANGEVEFEAEIRNGEVRIKVKVKMQATVTPADTSSTTEVSVPSTGDTTATSVADTSSTTLADVTSTTVAESPSTTVAESPSTTVAESPSTTVAESPSTTVAESPSTTLPDVTSTTMYDDDDDDHRYDDDDDDHRYDDDDDDRSTTSTTAPSNDADYGTKVFDVLGIGTVTIEWDADGITLIAVVSDPDWTIEVEKAGPKEIEIKFRYNGEEVEFEAEVEYGDLRVKMERESDS